MGTKKMRPIVAVLGLALAIAAPSNARSQSAADPERAAQLEAEAARLHEQPSRWADAVSLYLSAAQLRQHEDPQARQDLFMAANLAYQLGDLPAAVEALESAGTRAVSGGDAVFATQMFANAAVIAEEAGMADHERRLRTRVADLAGAVDAQQRRGRS
jgi:tetratricopeptide (TPR) repeat protein